MIVGSMEICNQAAGFAKGSNFVLDAPLHVKLHYKDVRYFFALRTHFELNACHRYDTLQQNLINTGEHHAFLEMLLSPDLEHQASRSNHH